MAGQAQDIANIVRDAVDQNQPGEQAAAIQEQPPAQAQVGEQAEVAQEVISLIL